MLAILTRVRWNLSVVLTCISFRARDGEHFFLVIWISSLEKVLLSSVAYFFFGHWFLRSLVFWALYIFWLSVLWCIASKHFLPLCGWPLKFRAHFFCCAEAFKFYVVHLSILSLSCWADRVLLRKSLPVSIVSRVFSALSRTNCMVSGLIARSLIQFELMLVQGDRHGSNLSFLQADSHFSHHHLLQRLSFLCCTFLAPLSKSKSSIQVHWSSYLFLCQYHAVFIAMAL
jgi:hypothetical protein